MTNADHSAHIGRLRLGSSSGALGINVNARRRLRETAQMTSNMIVKCLI